MNQFFLGFLPYLTLVVFNLSTYLTLKKIQVCKNSLYSSFNDFLARRTWRAYFCTSKPERKGNKAFSDWSNYCWGYNVKLSQFSPSFLLQFSSFATAWSGFQISMSYTSLGAQIWTFIGHIGSVRFKKY